MLLAAADKSLAVPDSLMLSLTGFLVVFIALMALIAVVKALTALSGRRKAAAQAAPGQQGDPPYASVSADMMPAAGSSGEIDLHNVDDHSAALIMAIVADRLQVPLNTLRFRSIKQIDEV